MFNVPVTYVLAGEFGSDEVRRSSMEAFAAAGAKHLVLSNHFISEIMRDHKYAAQINAEMAECGLTFMDAHSPFGGVLDLNCPDPCFRQQMLARHKLAINICAFMEVKTITIHPGSDRFFPEIPLEKHLDLMRDAIDTLLPEAEKCGVIVCIENSMSRAACPRRVTELKAEYDSPYLGLCYDSGHAHQLDAARNLADSVIHQYWRTVGVNEPEWDDQALERMLPEIVNCHLHDNDASIDGHRLPGNGTINWQKVIPLLKSAPKLQVIQCEVIQRPGETIAETCQKFAELGEI
ncbi:MAG: sugar phosphate isomerase/epimerase [Lentisphaerae bacterium]|nr:sugar phosphate isomerase/epimerase [Lentisphaerota bacterium]